MSPEELIEIFEDLLEWEERYSYIIELGKELPLIPEQDKTEKTKLSGCQSNVWLERQDSDIGFDFVADSDSQIVKGLIALVRLIYLNKKPQEILTLKIEALFEKIGLTGHLSPNRTNGLFHLIAKIRDWAKEEVSN